MNLKRYPLRWFLIPVVIIVIVSLFLVGRQRVRIETDVTASLPRNDPVIADARYIFTHHPIQDRVIIDLAQPGGDLPGLLAGAARVEGRLRESGLFRKVGLSDEQQVVPELISLAAAHLPVLFSPDELESEILPLLASTRVREAVGQNLTLLTQLDGVGQSQLIDQDPLGFRNLILGRLAQLAPVQGARFSQGQLVSADGKHVLIMAEPAQSGTDTRFSRQAAALLLDIAAGLNRDPSGGRPFVFTPVGAYRAALDNEEAAKDDTRKAVLFSTVAIAILLLLGFPRPFIGLLALFPAFAGTMTAFFVYSLFRDSISVLAVGFGGAIISFTVDYGIAYLLFLDRPFATRGLETTREVWSLGFLAMLTTAVSFAFLFLSDFPALAELGWFSALGVVFTYLFVHAVYPFLFPSLPPARRGGILPLQGLANRMASVEGSGKAWAALLFAVIMLFFACPDFRVNLADMNTVSRETVAAEKVVRQVWGDVFSRVHLVTEAGSLADLRRRGDRLAVLLEGETKRQALAAALVPSVLFPGPDRAQRNFAAWKAFWTPERIASLRGDLTRAAAAAGFSPQAFAPFFRMLEQREMAAPDLPERFYGLFGIRQSADGAVWSQFATLLPGPAYRGEDFYRRVSQIPGARIFDPALFTDRLGQTLFVGFMRVALIVGVLTLLVALVYLLDWQLTLIALLPTAFALICTLGTLNLLGQPLGIPAIIVSVVVIGMGTDYALYLVRSHQRYLDAAHPSLDLIRLSVLMSFGTTFLGFGVLALASHTLLKSAGLALVLGIGYSFVGAVTIVPPLLKRVFAPVLLPEETVVTGSQRHLRRTLRRYRHMEGYTRVFVRLKILLDPMFPRLAGFVTEPRLIIDIGCGYGVPAVWLLEIYPRARVWGIDPDEGRVRAASRAIGPRGVVAVGRAPDLPDPSGPADTALLLDMIHMLDDGALLLTLQGLQERMAPGGRLILRTTIPTAKRRPWGRWLETARLRANRFSPRYRSLEEVEAMLDRAGFRVDRVERSAPDREEFWFIGVRGEAS